MKYTASANSSALDPKRLGGVRRMFPEWEPCRQFSVIPHVFMDYDVQPTIDYFNWLGSNPEIEKLVNAEEGTKAEIVTAGQIYAYIKKIWPGKPATSWYYIAFSDCKTKATRGPSSLLCPKFGNINFPLDHKYLAKISYLRQNDQAVFVLLDNAGHELTGKHCSEIVDNYIEFRVKVSEYNFSGKTQTITVMKIVSAVVLPPLTTPPELPLAAKSKVALPSASNVGASSKSCVYVAEEGNKSTSNSNSDELQKAKCSKHVK
ncbi:hypothetical protein IGI04_007876 [Brassica rapa subsp. trilocularis]|uniref:Uncharacterized protein n=1 Tax=Brassica rapa subsp. trilocularis TaxID=1813537 RepID=A0ABQ7NKZ6_BRACM|nr:hypothetical protein IGI04_007876 [Brassica rapa subsp. trilocularis]